MTRGTQVRDRGKGVVNAYSGRDHLLNRKASQAGGRPDRGRRGDNRYFRQYSRCAWGRRCRGCQDIYTEGTSELFGAPCQLTERPAPASTGEVPPPKKRSKTWMASPFPNVTGEWAADPGKPYGSAKLELATSTRRLERHGHDVEDRGAILGAPHETGKIVRREPSEWPLMAHNGTFPPHCTSCSVQLRHTLA